MMEDIVKLHLQIVAVAFGCNYSRVGTLQWGDGTDGTKYDVRRTPASGGASTNSATASCRTPHRATIRPPEAAHHEIDGVRMQTLLVGLDAFKAHGLQNNSDAGVDQHDRRRSRRTPMKDVPDDHLGQRRRLPEAGHVHRRGQRQQLEGAEHHHGGGDPRQDGHRAHPSPARASSPA